MASHSHLNHVRSHQRRAARQKRAIDLLEDLIVKKPTRPVLVERQPQVNAAKTVFYTPSVTGKIIGYKTMDDTKPTETPPATSQAPAKSMSETDAKSKVLASIPTSTSTTTDGLPTLGFTSSATPTPSASNSSGGGGLSTGATAGIAVVSVFIFLGLIGLVFFFYRKRQNQKNAAYAEMHGDKTSDGGKRISSGKEAPLAAAPTASIPAAVYTAVVPIAPVASNSPFDEKQPPSPISPISTAPTQPPATASSDVSSFQNPTALGTPPPLPAGSVIPRAAAFSVAPSALKSDARKAPPPALNLKKTNSPSNDQVHAIRRQSANQNLSPLHPPAPLKSPSPSSVTSYTDASAPPSPVVATAAAASMVGAGTAAVHNHPPQKPLYRVRMDFVPSMGDELELKVGQLVRIHREYDDGWALCARFDDSQQGVCPRTCLSQHPIKPRVAPGAPPGARRPPPGVPAQQQPIAPSRAQSPALSFYSAQGHISPAPPVAPASQTATSNPPSSPGGYRKAQYRQSFNGRASPAPRSQSPVPHITVSSVGPERPASPTGNSQSTRPPTPPSQPKTVPHKPSPLSNVAAPGEIPGEGKPESSPVVPTAQEPSPAQTPAPEPVAQAPLAPIPASVPEATTPAASAPTSTD